MLFFGCFFPDSLTMEKIPSALLLLAGLASASGKTSRPWLTVTLFLVVSNSIKGGFSFFVALLTTSLAPPGAVEVIYKQVGETVTLDPPTGFESHKFYLTWSFEGFELGWRNHMGGRELTKGKWHVKISERK